MVSFEQQYADRGSHPATEKRTGDQSTRAGSTLNSSSQFRSRIPDLSPKVQHIRSSYSYYVKVQPT